MLEVSKELGYLKTGKIPPTQNEFNESFKANGKYILLLLSRKSKIV